MSLGERMSPRIVRGLEFGGCQARVSIRPRVQGGEWHLGAERGGWTWGKMVRGPVLEPGVARAPRNHAPSPRLSDFV